MEEGDSWPSALALLQEKTYELMAELDRADGQKERENILEKYLKETSQEKEGKSKLILPETEAAREWTWFNVESPLYVPDVFCGRLVVLDFFTYCCINCLHILPDLRKIESDHQDKADRLLVVGVHSAKFANERVNDNIAAACGRYDITHPVVNDAAAVWWSQMGISCWPTLVLLEPTSSQPVAAFVGEGHGRYLSAFVDFAMKFYSCDMAVTDRIELPPKATPGKTTHFLKYPGKICLDSSGKKMLVSDSGNHRVVIADVSSGKVLDVIGGGGAGFRDGTFQVCRLDSPQGVALLDDLLYIADTENHAIRVANLQSRKLTTLCGNGEQGHDLEGGGRGHQQSISSPWDVSIGSSPGACEQGDRDTLYVAMAGCHQIWAVILAESTTWWKGITRSRHECFAVAGTGKEENRNNSYPHKASFSQPSGLAWDDVKCLLYVADSESSSIRLVDIRNGGAVKAVCGGERDPTNLFAYGDVDGVGIEAKLQHPLGVAVASVSGNVFVADTYNHKLKSIVQNEKKFHCSTLTFGLEKDVPRSDDSSSQSPFSEPGGLTYDGGANCLYVADTNCHAVKRVCLKTNSVTTVDVGLRSDQDAVDSASPSTLETDVVCSAPCGKEVRILAVPVTPLEINREAPSRWRILKTYGDGVSCSESSGAFSSNGEAILTLDSESAGGLFVQANLYLCDSAAGTCSLKKFVTEIILDSKSKTSTAAPVTLSVGMESVRLLQ